jgi:hypothetical protein
MSRFLVSNTGISHLLVLLKKILNSQKPGEWPGWQVNTQTRIAIDITIRWIGI